MQDLQGACLSGLRRAKIQGPLHPSRPRRPVDAPKAVPNLQPAVYNLGVGMRSTDRDDLRVHVYRCNDFQNLLSGLLHRDLDLS